MPSLDGLIVLANFPSPDNGEAIANLTTGGAFSTVWVYTPEDPDSYWQDLNPQGYSPDRTKIIVQSVEQISGNHFAWWIANPDGSGRVKLTDTLPIFVFVGGGEYITPKDAGFRYLATGNQFRLTLKEYTSPAEWLYADGYITTDGAAEGHGPRITDAGQKHLELWSDPGTYDDAASIVTAEELDAVIDPPTPMWHHRYGPYYPSISPDGSKIALFKQIGPQPSRWQLNRNFSVETGGTFTLTVGTIGDLGSGETTTPIASDATAAAVWDALVALPNVVDPNPSSPFPRWSSSAFSWQVELGPGDHWMTADVSGLAPGRTISCRNISQLGGGGYRAFLCERDGADLHEFFVDQPNIVGFRWAPGSDYVYTIGPDVDDTPYCRMWRTDIATETPTVVYDGTDVNVGNGPLFWLPQISPDGSRMAYVLVFDTGFAQLWIANADGTDASLLYDQNYTMADATEDQLVLHGNNIAWSWDGSTLCTIDGRSETPVFLIDVATGDVTKIHPGFGWDDPDLVEYLNSPLSFVMAAPPEPRPPIEYQRIYSFAIDIADDGIESVTGLGTSIGGD